MENLNNGAMSLTFSCSKTLVRIAQEGVKDIIGEKGVHALQISGEQLHSPHRGDIQSVSLHASAPWLDALKEKYGETGMRGLAMRAGRASFSYFLREYGPETGLSGMAFRLLPARVRLRAGMDKMAQALNQNCTGQVQINEHEGSWVCQFEGKDLADAPAALNTAHYFMAGLLQEYLYWASGGKVYMLSSSGNAILINQQALE